MNCKDLRELVDSYLSNELLVETNHDVIRHLEHCRDCREMLGEHRELRAALKRAVIGADESQIDHAFAVRVKAQLRSTHDRPAWSLAGFRFAFGGLAVLIVGIFGVWMFVNRSSEAVDQASVPQPATANTIVPPAGMQIVPAFLAEVSHDAFDDHKNCALTHNLTERPISLEKAAQTVDVVNLGFDRSVIAALRERFGDEVELIKAHYCLINGRYFTHVVVGLANRTVSVLLTKWADGERASVEPMPCGRDGDLSAACFSSGGYAVFVISSSAESETLRVANTIAGAVADHIGRVRITA